MTLALDGGTPIRTAPLPRWPSPGDAEVEAVERVVRSGKLNYWVGDECRAFENEYAASLGRAHAIAVANGTLALELALHAFGIGPGDEVIVPARTFVATASAVVTRGAVPIVADIDVESCAMTADTVRPLLTERTRAIIPVHLGGWPADMAPLLELAEAAGVIVIEDCAQAHGARYAGRPVGALGTHAACFSFCQDKILPLGEGGMLLLDDDDAYRRAWEYKDHGKSLVKVNEAASEGGSTGFRFLVDSFGTNWRLTEMQAAMGRVGLASLPRWHELRTRNATRLATALEHTPGLVVPLPGDEFEHAFYRLYARVLPEALAEGWDRDRITRAIVAEGVPVQYGTCAEIYREAAFAAAGLGPSKRLPGAAHVHETSLAFFVHPTLGDDDIDQTAAAVRKVMDVATGTS